ncbi:MBL fold metallo-hydrolase [Rubrobacter indicoceani]|uniref:MBL fold metallo-hydrolase n=1 Tax=Rubrobacter indicoceani TaxID=2051957 RepID=UPI00196965ED|nr:MBL fold metallo-hydrolase [Rubrobacter indicoceani]
MILEMLTVGPFQENCYLVGDESSGSAVLIDPGDEAARIAMMVENTGLVVEKILLTHAHIDHVGAVVAAVEEYSCPVLAHEESVEMLGRLPQQAVMMGMKFGKIPEVDDFIPDGGEIKVGSLSLQALYTPGHSPGHLAFYEANEGFVVAGDALFAGSVGRVDLPGGDGPLLIRSITEKLLTLPGETLVCPGHGPQTTIARERDTNPFLQGGSLI